MSDSFDASRVLERMKEIDRRKLAAGKAAKDMQIAGRRELWRQNKRRNRALHMQIRTKQTKKCDSPQDPVFAQLFGPVEPRIEPKKENQIRKDLHKLSKDARAPASARVTALRTLAEMDGLVGKLQSQANDTSEQPLATLTREQLEEELARLRRNAAQGDT